MSELDLFFFRHWNISLCFSQGTSRLWHCILSTQLLKIKKWRKIYISSVLELACLGELRQVWGVCVRQAAVENCEGRLKRHWDTHLFSSPFLAALAQILHADTHEPRDTAFAELDWLMCWLLGAVCVHHRMAQWNGIECCVAKLCKLGDYLTWGIVCLSCSVQISTAMHAKLIRW